MNPWTHIPNRTPGRFRVGDRVRLRGYGVEAEILEDYVSLGGGRRFYTVLVNRGDGVEDTIGGFPEDEMEPLAPADGGG